MGTAARIRESSVTLPSWSGTLKSTRTKTRLPLASTSRIVSLSICVGRRSGDADGQALGDEADQVGHPAAVAPLVVVPRDHLDHRPADHHRRCGVDDRRAGVAPEVGRHERLVGDAQDPLERAGGGLAERGVDLLDRRRPGQVGGEVDDADRRRRDPQAEAVELALQVRDDQGQGLRRAGRGRDDVQRRRLVPGGGPCGPRRGCAGRWCTSGSCSSGRARSSSCRGRPWPPGPGSSWCSWRC